MLREEKRPACQQEKVDKELNKLLPKMYKRLKE
jgi:hypothetical protein